MTERIVRVLPDVSGIDSEFDYTVGGTEAVEVGTIVRVDLQGRRVRGWVTQVDSEPPVGVDLLPVRKVSSIGPAPEIIELAGWAAQRWTGNRSFYLGTSSPERNVSGLPLAVESSPGPEPTWFGSSGQSGALMDLAPADDYLDLLAETALGGSSLVVVPSRRAAERTVRELRRRGLNNVVLHPQEWARARAGGVTVVGTRAAAWAPMPVMTSVVVVDAYDEAHHSEASPTWNAIDVVAERARRAGVPSLLLSSVPRVVHGHNRTYVEVAQRNGWAPLSVLDIRKLDPHSARFPSAVVDLARSNRRVLFVLNRKGRAQLLVCSVCDEIVVCAKCGTSMRANDEATTICRRCEQIQPAACVKCSSTRIKQLRVGITRIREELETLALRPVAEVSSDTSEIPDVGVLVGTEAVLHRVGRADAVVFLEFDQELTATRYRATEDALVLLARASRVVGGHKRNGVVIVPTRLPDHEVLRAALHGKPKSFYESELQLRKDFDWPPFAALARISGAGAESFVEALPENVIALGPIEGTQWLVKAPNMGELSNALTSTKRPRQRLRIEVDPTRI